MPYIVSSPVITPPIDTPPAFISLRHTDIRSMLSDSHNRLLTRLASRWNTISHTLQTSSEDPKSAPPNTSTVHAELSLDAMLQLLLFIVHLAPPVLRLQPLVDSIFDCGSGYCWCLLLAYAGVGIENVCGLESVKQWAQTSMSHLGIMLNEFGFDLSYGHRDESLYPLDNEMKLKSMMNSSLRNGKKRSKVEMKETLEEAKCLHIANKSILLPQGVHIFEGDIGVYLMNGPDCEVVYRFRNATHLCFFDLCFSKQTVETLAKELSQVKGRRWKLFCSMLTTQVEWKNTGLNGWNPLGHFRGLSFKGGQQIRIMYLYVVDSATATWHDIDMYLKSSVDVKFTGSDRLQPVIQHYFNQNNK